MKKGETEEEEELIIIPLFYFSDARCFNRLCMQDQ